MLRSAVAESCRSCKLQRMTGTSPTCEFTYFAASARSVENAARAKCGCCLAAEETAIRESCSIDQASNLQVADFSDFCRIAAMRVGTGDIRLRCRHAWKAITLGRNQDQTPMLLRYSVGDIPLAFLNARLKLLAASYPRSEAIPEIVFVGMPSNSVARFMRTSFTI